MTEAIAFDTHRFVKRLTGCGFTETQAETLADEHVALLNANLATKADIAAVQADTARLEVNLAKVEANLKADLAKLEVNLAKVEANLKANIAKLEAKTEASKADLLKWMVSALIAQGALIVALVKLL